VFVRWRLASLPFSFGKNRRWKRELAGLRERLACVSSDFENTVSLREYVGALIGIGCPDTKSDTLYRSVDFRSFRLATFYTLFKDRRLQAACGITTFFYIKLLHEFDFAAYQYSFGFKSEPFRRLIHSVVLVQIVFRGSKRLIIQDPYFNLTYRTNSGDPMDFFEFLAAIRNRDYNLITVDSPALAAYLRLTDPAAYFARLQGEQKAAFEKAVRTADGCFSTEIPIVRNYETLFETPYDNFASDFLDALRRHGWNEPFLYAYRLRAADLVGSPDHAALQARIDAAVA
jgi:hypothetical protein